MKSWSECVLEAKALVRRMKSDRLQIARLAVIATSNPSSSTTMRLFAEAIDVNPKTLAAWVTAYEQYRIKHPVKEPEPKDYAPAAKAVVAARAERRAAAPIQETRGRPVAPIDSKARSFLSDVNRLKERLKLKGEVKGIDTGVRNELVVKLKEVIKLLESV